MHTRIFIPSHLSPPPTDESSSRRRRRRRRSHRSKSSHRTAEEEAVAVHISRDSAMVHGRCCCRHETGKARSPIALSIQRVSRSLRLL